MLLDDFAPDVFSIVSAMASLLPSGLQLHRYGLGYTGLDDQIQQAHASNGEILAARRLNVVSIRWRMSAS